MSDNQDDQDTADDHSTTAAPDSDQQSSETPVKGESADQTTDVQAQGDQSIEAQSAGDAGTPQADPNCDGWYSDAESTSKRAAEFFVKNELTGDRGVVEKIDVVDRDDPESYSCTVHFSDKATNIEVVVFRNEIIAREDLPSLDDRWTCWYNYKCPPPNKDLVLTKRKCNMMAPVILRLPSK